MNSIGIDFGTSFCTSSWINPVTDTPEAIIFHDDNSQLKMPTVVYFSPEGRIEVGQVAYERVEDSLKMEIEARRHLLSSVVMDIKQTMQKDLSFLLASGGKLTYEEIIAHIFKKIGDNASKCCFNNKPVEGVTITHPVVFQSWQKEMLRKAAQIAGFTEIKLLQEPVAAALGYAAVSGKQVGKGILVYDFGGGTFDVAYVQQDDEGEFLVPVEPEGEASCGGNNIDEVLYQRWEQVAMDRFGRTISENRDYVDPGFKTRCRKHKETMSKVTKNRFTEVLPPPNFHRAEMELTRQEFDALAEPVITRTIVRTERLLKKVKEKGLAVDVAIMIGGSSRIPQVYERLKQILPVEPQQVMQVDVAVALGAILHGKIKTRQPQRQDKVVYCLLCGRPIPANNRFCIYDGSPRYSN